MVKPTVLVIGAIPPPYGGTETITELIINSNYLKQKFKLIFLQMWKTCRQEDRGKFGWMNLIRNFKNLVKFWWLVLRHNPQIIYLPLAQNKGGFLRDSLFILLGWVTGKKIVIHFHGGGFDSFYAKQRSVFKCYIKLILSCANKLIVLANRLRSQFKGLIPSNKITLLYNGIDVYSFPDHLKSRNDDPRNYIRVLFVGNISKVKGTFDLVRAIPIIRSNSNIHVLFQFVGAPINKERTITFKQNVDNGYSELQHFIRKHNLGQHVEFLGELYGQSKVKTFLEADIFVLPSYSEGFSIVILEAMAASLPIVATPVGAMPEVLKEGANCLFVKIANPVDLADKIMTLIKNPELMTLMGNNNRRLVQTKLNAETFTQGLADIWNRVLAAEIATTKEISIK